MHFSKHAQKRLRERKISKQEVSQYLQDYDVRYSDKDGNPIYKADVGNRRIKVVRKGDDPNFVITVTD